MLLGLLAASPPLLPRHHCDFYDSCLATVVLVVPVLLPLVPQAALTLFIATQVCCFLLHLQVVPVPLPLVSDISTLRVSIPADLRPPEARKAGENAQHAEHAQRGRRLTPCPLCYASSVCLRCTGAASPLHTST